MAENGKTLKPWKSAAPHEPWAEKVTPRPPDASVDGALIPAQLRGQPCLWYIHIGRVEDLWIGPFSTSKEAWAWAREEFGEFSAEDHVRLRIFVQGRPVEH